jgi:hypothetical protein
VLSVDYLETIVDILRDVHIDPPVLFGAGLIGFVFGVVVLHIIGRIAARLGKSYWLFFFFPLIPFVGFFFFLPFARMPWWYAFGFLFPPLGLVIYAAAWGRIAQALGKSFWLYAIGMCIPVVNVVLFITLAF